MSETSRTPVVLYVMGAGRSGTTLLGRVIGAHDGYVNVGELRFLWQRGILEARSCGCGRPIPSCYLWSQVLDLVSDELSRTALAAKMSTRQGRHLRWLHTWSVLGRR